MTVSPFLQAEVWCRHSGIGNLYFPLVCTVICSLVSECWEGLPEVMLSNPFLPLKNINSCYYCQISSDIYIFCWVRNYKRNVGNNYEQITAYHSVFSILVFPQVLLENFPNDCLDAALAHVRGEGFPPELSFSHMVSKLLSKKGESNTNASEF